MPESKTAEKVTRLNLNDTVFFELNDVSLKLLAPTTEEQVKLIRDNVTEHTVDGKTRHLARMQLHDFIRKFSAAMGPGNPAPIAGNDLYVIEKTTTVSGPVEPPAKSLKEPRDPREVSRQLMVFLSAHSAKVGLARCRVPAQGRERRSRPCISRRGHDHLHGRKRRGSRGLLQGMALYRRGRLQHRRGQRSRLEIPGGITMAKHFLYGFLYWAKTGRRSFGYLFSKRDYHHALDSGGH